MASVYRIGEFASKIGRSASTVRRWETEGRIVARRSPSGQRYVTDADVHAVLTPGFDSTVRETVVHTFSCRLYGLRRYEKTLKNDDLTGGPA